MFNRSRIGVIALVVSLLLMLGAVVMVATSPAAALPTADGFEYKVMGDTVEITGYIGPNPAVIIPSNIDTVPVTSIKEHAFDGNTTITSVQIPESVISIKKYAFQGCTNLVTVSFVPPSTLLYIEDYAFASCSSLTSITIPDSVNTIGNGAFQSCVALTGINVDAGNSIYASVDGVLYDKAITVLIQYPLAKPGIFIVPGTVNTIQSYAFFSSTGLTGVTIPNSVNVIGDSAFSGCTSLTRMEFVGDQPTLGPNWITNNAGLTVYYHDGKAGFTTPTWLGIESIPIYDLIMITNFGTTSPGGSFEQGTTVNITARAPTANPGEKYVFKGWTGTGGAYTGTENPASFTIGGSGTETASWTLQYLVSFAVNAAEMGSINPTGLDQWVNSGPLTLQATPSPGHDLKTWTSDNPAITFGTQTASPVANIGGPGMITATFRLTPISVTITSNPTGNGYVWVDGAAIFNNITYSWLPGSIHTVEAKDLIGSGEKYLFTTWSDGGLRAHPYTVTMSSATITANFSHQYSLTMAATGGSTTPAVGTTWHDVGSKVTLDATPPPVPVGIDAQYVWKGWTGSGNGSYAGPDKPATNAVTVDGPITETAIWTLQYQVAFAVIPAGGGTTLPATGSDWYDAGTLPIQATPSLGYAFSSWTSDGGITIGAQSASAVANIGGPGTITATFKLERVSVTITSSPTGTGYVLVDGIATETPKTFNWFPGESHSLEATNISVGTGEQYSFISWSDDGLQVHSYMVTFSSVTITATFGHQYLLTMASNGGATTPAVGPNWLNVGSKVTLDATAPPAGTGFQYVWNGWTGTGAGSYTGTNKPATNAVTIRGPITETSSWNKQYLVTFAVTPVGGGTTTPTSNNQWINAGTIAIKASNFTDYVFSSWTSGTASITFAAQAPSTTVTINGPGTITANFVLVRGITITSNPTLGSGYVKVDGNPIVTPQNYRWLSGTTHNIEAISSVLGVAGEQYVFNSWSDAGSRAHTYTVTVLNATVTANFDHQYLLKMATNMGTTIPGANGASTWQGAGSTVRIDASVPAASAVNERYRWAGWTGIGSGNYTGASALPAIDVVMYGPITQTAKWNLQYQITTATNFGTTDPIAGNHWFDAGSKITFTAYAPTAGPAERYIFNGWTGAGLGAYNGMDNPATNAVIIKGPITETASWTLQKVAGGSVPELLTKAPSGNAESTLITVNVVFSEAMNRAYTIISVAGVNGTVVWNGNSVSFKPTVALKGGTSYNVSVNGMDLAGNTISKTWTFKTAMLGKISGVVHGYDGKVLANAIVKLIGRSTAAQTEMNHFSLAATSGLVKVQTTTTDAYGVYGFYDVAIGNYTLEVALPGYQVRSMDVAMTVAAVEAGGLTIDPRASPASLTDGILFFTVILVIAAAISGLVLVVRKRRSSPTGPKTVEKAPEPNGEELASKEWGEAGKIE